ncbi:MAG: hypothetical protein IKZ16_01040 [Clostridia bacterium]|nr:hypothetical protein [Clostridia bacterium]MBR5880245.1 hypothetical protein [Clostridia bacterium]
MQSNGRPDYKEVLCDERHDRIEARLTKHGEQIDSLEKCTIKLTEMVDFYDQLVRQQEARIRTLESKPGLLLEHVIGYVASAVLGALGSALVGYFIS